MFKTVNTKYKYATIISTIKKALDNSEGFREAVNESDWAKVDSFLNGFNWGYPYIAAFWQTIYEIEPDVLTKLGYVPAGFFAYTDIEDIDLPEGITSIQYSAFYKSNINSIWIPKSIERLEGYCLHSNSNFISIKYNGTVKEWRKIKKDSDWLSDKYEPRSADVYCIDERIGVGKK